MVEIVLLCFSLFSMLGGILLIIYSKRLKGKKLKTCSYKTTAEIVGVYNTDHYRYQDIDECYVGNFAPVYGYYYNGQYYTAVSSVSCNRVNFQLGSKITLHINPQNPLDIYEPQVGNVAAIIATVIGVILILASIPWILIEGLFVLFAILV